MRAEAIKAITMAAVGPKTTAKANVVALRGSRFAHVIETELAKSVATSTWYAD